MSSYKLRIYEAIGLVLTIMLINLVLQVPSSLISITGSATSVSLEGLV